MEILDADTLGDFLLYLDSWRSGHPRSLHGSAGLDSVARSPSDLEEGKRPPPPRQESASGLY